MKIVSLSFALGFVASFLLVGLTSSSPYDPWYDFNHNGEIDIFDIVDIAGRYGTTGTPINTTELLQELQDRLDTLNATIMELQAQSTCVVQSGKYDGEVSGNMVEDSGANTVINFVPPFTTTAKPQMTIAVVLKQAADGLTEGSAIKVVEDVKGAAGFWTGFDLTVSKYSGGSISDTTQVFVTWIAMGAESTGWSENLASYYANTETLMTISSGSVEITFPSGMFTSAPSISATGVVLSGSHAGKPLYIADMTISATSATLDLECWDGAAWQDLGGAVYVQLSFTAVAISVTKVEGLAADTINTSTNSAGNVYISYPVGEFSATPQHLAVTAQFNSGGLAQMGHVTVSSHDQFGFWLNVKDGSGTNWNGNVQVSYVALQTSEWP